MKFIENLMQALAKLSSETGAHIWVPILAVILVFGAFGIGYFLKWKWSISKLVVLIVTIIVAGATGASIYATFKNDEDLSKYKSLIPFAITLFSLVFYAFLNIIVFIVNFIVHLSKRKKNKLKPKKRVSRLLSATANSLLTVLPVAAFSNLLLIGTKKSESFQKATSYSVKVMTAGQGESVAGIFGEIDNVVQFIAQTKDIQEFLNKDYSKLSNEEKEQLSTYLKNVSSLINEPRVQAVAFDFIKEVASDLNIEEKFGEVVDKAYARMRVEKPETFAQSKEKQKEAFTDFVREKLEQVYDEVNTADPNFKSDINTIKKISSNLTQESIKKLSNLIDSEIIKRQETRDKADVAVVVEEFLKVLKLKEHKETNKEQNNIG
ncbi:hypothetical protein [Mycoplasma leonicaptivi]|uniref:hypothetical protein n=1 Tax=Mycoplasma leonicaptivi TaxID=36742 RepID=UPI000488D50F|nr:hypothetical protein [Mycoplasma leonicaptivi]